MGRKIPAFVVFLLLSIVQVFGQQENFTVQEPRITLHLQNQPVAVVLDSIAAQTGLFFSYDPVAIRANHIINVSFSGTQLQSVLQSVLNPDFEWYIVKDQIVISPRENLGINTVETEQKQDSIVSLNGRIVDLGNNEPVAYASVSLLGKPVGTISNIDGDFVFKIRQENRNDTLLFSCLGYQKYFLPVRDFELEKNNIFLRPVSIRIKEIKVKAVDARSVVEDVIEKIKINYQEEPYLMTSFYRETLQQNGKYINVSEAVMEILKASYGSEFSEDRTRVVKGRKSKHEQLFRWVDFKIQGGPYYITMIDAVKRRESFLNEEQLHQYKYEIEDVIFYRERPTYVIGFKSTEKRMDSNFDGKLYVDRETNALVQVNFALNNTGLRNARLLMIKKKPRGFHVRPVEVSYQVVYQPDKGKWFLQTAQAHVVFKVRSRDDKINAYYTSNSDLLITDYRPSEIKRFRNSEIFHADDIFTETIVTYDESFWGQYNIIKPSDDLSKALRSQKKK